MVHCKFWRHLSCQRCNKAMFVNSANIMRKMRFEMVKFDFSMEIKEGVYGHYSKRYSV